MKKCRILIADDDPSLLDSLSIRLTAEGYEVFRAQDGYQALAFARTHMPDLLLLDISMPAGDGFSVHERLKKFAMMRQTPIIYVTGTPPKVSRTSPTTSAPSPFSENPLTPTNCSSSSAGHSARSPTRHAFPWRAEPTAAKPAGEVPLIAGGACRRLSNRALGPAVQ